MIFFVADFIRWLILTRKRYRLIGYLGWLPRLATKIGYRVVKDKNRALPTLLPLVNCIGNAAHSIDKKLVINRIFYSI
jgi:hypothetical protein